MNAVGLNTILTLQLMPEPRAAPRQVSLIILNGLVMEISLMMRLEPAAPLFVTFTVFAADVVPTTCCPNAIL